MSWAIFTSCETNRLIIKAILLHFNESLASVFLKSIRRPLNGQGRCRFKSWGLPMAFRY